ncbi:MAG: pirin family protein [Bdellovibrionales bacterium]|nr:pirin family protein [Bdellovibrionales bacterium]
MKKGLKLIRKSEERGQADLGWLKAKYTFSFADYFDRNYMGFRTLRVINQDIIQPSGGFATHPHNDMEILTFVIRGTVEHKDSMGNSTLIPAGEVQLMSAGTGVRHSEFNPSSSDKLELLQIWIVPDRKGHTPNYQQMKLDSRRGLNEWQQLVGPYGLSHNGMSIHQQVAIYRGLAKSGQSLVFRSQHGGNIWIQIVDGEVEIEEDLLKAGDGLAMTESSQISLLAKKDGEVLLFDLG